MYDFDLTTLRGWVSAVWQLIAGVLRLDPAAFQACISSENGLLLALIVLLVSGISLSIGQSVVLFANRVSPKRFALSLLGSALMMTISMTFWAISSWLIVTLLLGNAHPVRDFVIVVALGSAPAILGFWVLVPYLGNILAWLLRVWIFFAILVGMGAVMGLTFWQALLSCGLGWLLLELLARLPVFDPEIWRARVWRATTGQAERLGAEEQAVQMAAKSTLGLSASQADNDAESHP
jgi:hypothetical protein